MKKNKTKAVIPIATVKDFDSEVMDLEIKKQGLYQKAIESEDPNIIMKANNYFSNGSMKNVNGMDIKSMLVDPMDFMNTFEYKDRPTHLTYGMLQKMATTPITAATIRTRIAQVLKFCQPQIDKFSAGFTIRLKDREAKPSKEDKKNIKKYIDFFLNTGEGGPKWGRDDFETFIAKIVRDSLTYDQYTAEIIESRRGLPTEFIATDAASYRIATADDRRVDFETDPLTGQKRLPRYVQIYNTEVVSDFYEWELMFGVRNPRTDLRTFGYGFAELEELVTIITSLLWSEEYNRRAFSQGSFPKGLIKLSGNVNDQRLAEFKKMWQMQMAGVYNSFKIPILQADKMDWVPIDRTNRDMEYSAWVEFLIKIHSALFLIDPSEINFELTGSANNNSLFTNSDNETKIKYSKDKGLSPLLSNIEKKLNKHIMSRLDPRYEFAFVGQDVISPDTILDRQIKQLTNFRTVDEIRAENDLPPLGEEKGGNLVLNAQWITVYNQKAMREAQMQQGQGEDGFGNEEEDYDPLKDNEEEEDFGKEQEEDDSDFGKAIETNPYMDDLQGFVNDMLIK